MFYSYPDTTVQIKATQARLDAIYNASKKGLKEDAIAFAVGLIPQHYRQLMQLDPRVELAAQKGRADGEMEMSTVLHELAMKGDVKAASMILTHVYKWQQPQNVTISVEGNISITQALERANKRIERHVIEGVARDITDMNISHEQKEDN